MLSRLAALLALIVGILAPSPPTHNLAPNPNFAAACATVGVHTLTCTAATADAIDHARRREGLGPLYLPRDWTSLSPAEQIFVVTNLERVARGERPVPGLTARLDAIAAVGAANHTDPIPPPDPDPAASIWANDQGPLASDYNWMYQDGWGGPGATLNLDCRSADAEGCWGHRDNILAEWFQMTRAGSLPPYVAAGAAQQAMENAESVPSVSDAMIVAVLPAPPTYVYTWQQAIAAGAASPSRGWNPVAGSQLMIALVTAWVFVRRYALEALVLAYGLFYYWRHYRQGRTLGGTGGRRHPPRQTPDNVAKLARYRRR